MSTFKGIDVSEQQGVIDWKKVKKAGIDFAIIHAGYGHSASQKDKRFEANIKGAKDAGIDVGAYWFSYAVSAADAKREAEVCAEVLNGYQLEYPVFYDFEYDSAAYAKQKGVKITKNLATSFAVSFLETLEKGGYYVGNYTNLDYYKNYFEENQLKKYEMWLAQYSGNSKEVKRANIWQYSDTGKISGISTAVDLNYCYVDYPSMIKTAGKNGYKNESTENRTATQKRFGLSDSTMKFLDQHSNAAGLYKKLATADKIKSENTDRATVQKRYHFTDHTMEFLDQHGNAVSLYKKLAEKG